MITSLRGRGFGGNGPRRCVRFVRTRLLGPGRGVGARRPPEALGSTEHGAAGTQASRLCKGTRWGPGQRASLLTRSRGESGVTRSAPTRPNPLHPRTSLIGPLRVLLACLRSQLLPQRRAGETQGHGLRRARAGGPAPVGVAAGVKWPQREPERPEPGTGGWGSVGRVRPRWPGRGPLSGDSCAPTGADLRGHAAELGEASPCRLWGRDGRQLPGPHVLVLMWPKSPPSRLPCHQTTAACPGDLGGVCAVGSSCIPGRWGGVLAQKAGCGLALPSRPALGPRRRVPVVVRQRGSRLGAAAGEPPCVLCCAHTGAPACHSAELSARRPSRTVTGFHDQRDARSGHCVTVTIVTDSSPCHPRGTVGSQPCP